MPDAKGVLTRTILSRERFAENVKNVGPVLRIEANSLKQSADVAMSDKLWRLNHTGARQFVEHTAPATRRSSSSWSLFGSGIPSHVEEVELSARVPQSLAVHSKDCSHKHLAALHN